MKQELQQIAEHLERINRDLREESQVWEAEQKDRLAKGLKAKSSLFEIYKLSSIEMLPNCMGLRRKPSTKQ